MVHISRVTGGWCGLDHTLLVLLQGQGQGAESGATSPICSPPPSLPYPTCSSFLLMVTVMGPSVARYRAIPGGRGAIRPYLVRSPCSQLMVVSISLPPTPIPPSLSVAPSVCLCPGLSVPVIPPPPTHIRLGLHPALTLLVVRQHDEILDPGHLFVLLSLALGSHRPLEWVVLFASQATWK